MMSIMNNKPYFNPYSICLCAVPSTHRRLPNTMSLFLACRNPTAKYNPLDMTGYHQPSRGRLIPAVHLRQRSGWNTLVPVPPTATQGTSPSLPRPHTLPGNIRHCTCTMTAYSNSLNGDQGPLYALTLVFDQDYLLGWNYIPICCSSHHVTPYTTTIHHQINQYIE